MAVCQEIKAHHAPDHFRDELPDFPHRCPAAEPQEASEGQLREAERRVARCADVSMGKGAAASVRKRDASCGQNRSPFSRQG